MSTRKALEVGGIIAAVVLMAFGIGAIVMGFNGRSTVQDNLKQQKITGTPDMTPAGITAAVKEAGLSVSATPIPSCSVANQAITTGAKARCFAQYMNIHALEATHGQVYSQMGQFLDKTGKPTDNKAAAAIDPKTGQPVPNAARNTWVTETALTTALNTSYMADQISLFGIVVGIALLLAGIGFAILSTAGALRNPDSVLKLGTKRSAAEKVRPVPAA